LEALPSGNLIPILSFERGSDDDFWSSWMSGDFGAFAVGPGLQKLSALERFNFLGRWMARAYIISSVGHSPASFHSVIYESIVAGRAVAPEPAPNAYQDRLLCQPYCLLLVPFTIAALWLHAALEDHWPGATTKVRI
jgi:hypothetical protein